MKTIEFLSVLENNQNKELIFEYQPTKWVGANYHITEIKNVAINSVDCGGKANAWKETIVQLWESPKEVDKRTYLKSDKVHDIFKRVDSINPLWKETAIKFEYSNDAFHTAQLNVFDVEVLDNKLIVKLHSEKTDCKAKELCVPVEKEMTATTCKPNSGCC